MSSLKTAIQKVIAGREHSYCSVESLMNEMQKLIVYAISNRSDMPVHDDEKEASLLVAEAVSLLGSDFDVDINIGRDLWELVSEDSQAQWLYPPSDIDGAIIALVNVANNMAKDQCYIAFS